jgi:hypothetical protein
MPPRPVFGPAVEAKREGIAKAARAMLAAAIAGRGSSAKELRELLHLLRELGQVAKELGEALSDDEERR